MLLRLEVQLRRRAYSANLDVAMLVCAVWNVGARQIGNDFKRRFDRRLLRAFVVFALGYRFF